MARPLTISPRTILTLVACLAASAEPEKALGQEVIRIGDRVSCPQCRIEVALDARLDPDGLSRAPVSVARAQADDRILVVDSSDRDRVTVFDRSGEYLGTLGAAGAGPGEFDRIGLVVAGERHLHVFDRGNGRHSWLTHVGEYVGSGRAYEFLEQGVELGVDSIVLNGDVNTPERIGLPLHLIDHTGQIARSFGSEVPSDRPDLPWMRMRALSPRGSRAVWSGLRTRYRVDLWNIQGTLEMRISRDASWFTPYESYRPIDPQNPPRPWLQALWDDGRHLWIAVHVVGANWEEAFGPPDPDAGGSRRVVDSARLFDTTIEVLDVAEGRLMASITIPEMALAFLGSGKLVTYRVDDDGLPAAEIWAVRLREAGSKER